MKEDIKKKFEINISNAECELGDAFTAMQDLRLALENVGLRGEARQIKVLEKQLFDIQRDYAKLMEE